jgi:hypothetical protein
MFHKIDTCRTKWYIRVVGIHSGGDFYSTRIRPCTSIYNYKSAYLVWY